MAIVDSGGNTVASSTSGPVPRTATATVAPGDYRIVVTPTSGRGVWTLAADYPPAERRLDIGYDGNDHATRIDNGTTTVAETLDPGGRVIARQVTDNATNTVVEDLTVGYDGPRDAAAYERHADGTRVTYLFAAGVLLTHSSSSGSQWGVAAVDGDLVGTTDLTGAFTPNAVADEYGRVPGGGERLEWLGTHRRFAADTMSGLVRMGVRLYDPALGRFLETDPVESGSANDYDYVSGDPVNDLDLDGRMGEGQCRRNPELEICQRRGRGVDWNPLRVLVRIVCRVASYVSVASIPGAIVSGGTGAIQSWMRRGFANGAFQGSARVVARSSGIAVVVGTAVDVGCRVTGLNR